MPLTPVQLDFVEKYILGHKLVEMDLAGVDEGMRESTKGVGDLAREASELMNMLATLKPPPSASRELTAKLVEHDRAMRGFLDHPLQMSGVRAAAAEIKAMGETHASALHELATRSETVKALRLRVTKLLQLLDTEALKADVDEAERQKGVIERGLTDPPPQSGPMGTLDQAVGTLATLVSDANQRVVEDRQKRTEAATKLRSKAGHLGSTLDLEVAEPGRTELLNTLAELEKAMVGTPTQEALDQADSALNTHAETARKANEDAVEKRNARAKRRTELIDLAKATVSDASDGESKDLALAAGKITEALPDPAGDKDIDTAEKALLVFQEKVTLLTELVNVRRSLVVKGSLALARLEWGKGVFDLPAATPESRANAIKDDAKNLATEGARYGRMDEAHTWAEIDLTQFGKQIDTLATRAIDLKKEVEESAKQVGLSAKAARDAVAAPKSGWAFSGNQKKDFEDRITVAEKTGTDKMDDAPGALSTLAKLKVGAEELARRLTALAARINRIDAAPADALDKEKGALADAKKKATDALGEVLAE